MKKTLEKHGDQYALVIDQQLIDMLDIDPKMQFEVFSDGRSLVVVPLREQTDDAFEQALASVHARYGNAMKKLA